MIRALLRDGAVYAIGTVVARGLGLLLLPLYTRALPPEPFGLLDLIVTAGALVNLVVPLEIPQAVARLWNERAPGGRRRALAGTALVFAVLAYALFTLLAWTLAAPIATMLGGRPADTDAVRAGAAFIALNGVMLVLQAQFRWALRSVAFAMTGVAYAAIVLAGMAALVAAESATVARVLWLQAMAAALVSAGSAIALRGEFALVLDRAELRRMLDFSLPLVPAGAAVFAAVHLHRFVLGAMTSLDEVGLFGIAARVASLASLVLIGVQTALTPLIYAHHDEAETPARLARLLEGFWAAALLACLAITLFGRELVALLAAPEYASAAPLLAWLAPAALLAQMYIFSPGIALAKKTRWQLALTVVSAAFGLVLAWGLIPGWRASGAAIAAFAGASVFFGTWLAAGQRLYPLPLRWQALTLATLSYGLLAWAGAVRVDLEAGGAMSWAVRIASLAVLAAVLGFTGLLRLRRASTEAVAEGVR